MPDHQVVMANLSLERRSCCLGECVANRIDVQPMSAYIEEIVGSCLLYGYNDFAFSGMARSGIRVKNRWFVNYEILEVETNYLGGRKALLAILFLALFIDVMFEILPCVPCCWQNETGLSKKPCASH